MITPRVRSLVSAAAALNITLTLGGCAAAAARAAPDGPAGAGAPAPAVHFDNRAHEHAHVYLVGERREWLLGRVEPGRRVALRIPAAALAEGPWWMRLAVLTGERVTLRAADHPRASITMAQPVSELLALRWTFSQTPTAGRLEGLRQAHAEVPRR